MLILIDFKPKLISYFSLCSWDFEMQKRVFWNGLIKKDRWMAEQKPKNDPISSLLYSYYLAP